MSLANCQRLLENFERNVNNMDLPESVRDENKKNALAMRKHIQRKYEKHAQITPVAPSREIRDEVSHDKKPKR